MRLMSVNRGRRQTHLKGSVPEITGIYKIPISEPVEIHGLGIAEDFIGDSKNHGGPDQAIYVYGGEDYAWWNEALGRELLPGTFGENLTVSDLESDEWSIGDRLRIGPVLLEVTAPRIPCSTLAARMGDSGFARRFRAAERPGLYCRVLQPGAVQAENSVERIPWRGDRVGILDVFRAHIRAEKDEQDIRRILRAPIAVRERFSLERHLTRLAEGGER